MSEPHKKTLGMAIASLVLGCLFIIPLLGMLFSLVALILGIVALVKISNNKETLQGKGLAISGIVLGAVGILLIPIIGLLAAIAIPNLLRARLAANEAYANETVKTISTASEVYFANNGKYPASEDDLKRMDYILEYYDKTIKNGYVYLVKLSSDGYEVVAQPQKCGVTGKRVFIAKNEGVFSEEDCE